MRSQQQADREEQQRIKNLVLNYEMANDNNEHDGNEVQRLNQPLRINRRPGLERRSVRESKEKPGQGHRGTFRSRRLQLSDVNW